MGDSPTIDNSLRGLEHRWKEFRRPLRAENKARFDQLFEYGRRHSVSAGAVSPVDVARPLFLAICLEQERRIDELEQRLEAIEAETDLDLDLERTTSSREDTDLTRFF